VIAGNPDIYADVELLPLDARRRLQEELLPAQIEHVRAGSPFYAERLGDRPVRTLEDLAALPFVTKSELLAAQAEDPPLGAIAGVALEQIVRLHITSGTTGTPLMIGFTRGDLERSMEAGARAFWAAGVRPDRTILHCVNYAFYAGGIADHMSLEATGATVVPVGLGQSDRLLDLFPSLRPDAIFAITSYANHLAGRAREKGLDPAELGLRTIVTGGEPGGDIPEVRARIEATWGARVTDTYGLGDVWPTLAAQCELRDGFHFTTPDLLVTELVDPETDRVLEWEPGATGELVYTHLVREASPLVRFRSRDRAAVLALDCGCGRGTPRFRLLGRVDDMIVVRGVNVFPSAIERLLAEAIPTLRGFAVVLDEAIPTPPLAVVVEAEQELPDGLAHMIRERLQVQVEITALPPGTMATSEQKTKRIWRRYAGEEPGW
jgi:phenylacetate-CoA ligase